MSDPVEEGDRPNWGLWIALVLVGLGLTGAWVTVWYVASHNIISLPSPSPPKPPKPPPPILDRPQPKAVAGPGGHMVSNPDWRRLPSGDAIARYYPEEAQRLAIGGSAVIACTIALDGQLMDCTVVSETPPGREFGAAAIRMSTEFRMWPGTVDGKPVEGRKIRIPIVFQPPR